MVSEAISHFLNCLLSEGKDSREPREEVRGGGKEGGAGPPVQPSLTNGHVRKKKNKRKASRGQKGVREGEVCTV